MTAIESATARLQTHLSGGVSFAGGLLQPVLHRRTALAHAVSALMEGGRDAREHREQGEGGLALGPRFVRMLDEGPVGAAVRLGERYEQFREAGARADAALQARRAEVGAAVMLEQAQAGLVAARQALDAAGLHKNAERRAAAQADAQQRVEAAQAGLGQAGAGLQAAQAQVALVQQQAAALQAAREGLRAGEEALFARAQEAGAGGGAQARAVGQLLEQVLRGRQAALEQSQAELQGGEREMAGVQARVAQERERASGLQDRVVELDAVVVRVKGELEAAKVPQALGQRQLDERGAELAGAQAQLAQAQAALAAGRQAQVEAQGHKNKARRAVARDAARVKIEAAQQQLDAAQAAVAGAQARLAQAQAQLAPAAQAVEQVQARWEQAVGQAQAARAQAQAQLQVVEQAMAQEVQAHRALGGAQAQLVATLRERVDLLGQAVAAGVGGAGAALRDAEQALGVARAQLARQEQALAAAQVRAGQELALGRPLEEVAAAAEGEANRLQGLYEQAQLQRVRAEQEVAQRQAAYDRVAGQVAQARADVQAAVDAQTQAHFHKDKGNRLRALAVASKALTQAEQALGVLEPQLAAPAQALEQAKAAAEPAVQAALQAQAQAQAAAQAAAALRAQAGAQAQAARQAVRLELSAQAGVQASQATLIQLGQVQPEQLHTLSASELAQWVQLREHTLADALDSVARQELSLEQARAGERAQREAANPVLAQALGLQLVAHDLLGDVPPAQQASTQAQAQVQASLAELDAAQAALRQHEGELFAAEERAFRADYVRKPKKKASQQAVAQEQVRAAQEAIAQAKTRLATAEDDHARAVRRAAPLLGDAQDSELAARGVLQEAATRQVQAQAQQGWAEQASVRQQAADATLAYGQALVVQSRQAHAQALAALAESSPEGEAAQLLGQQARAGQAQAEQYAALVQDTRAAAQAAYAQQLQHDTLAVQAAAPQMLGQFLEVKVAAAGQVYDQAREQVGVRQQDFEQAIAQAAQAAPVAEDARSAMFEQDLDVALEFALRRSGRLVSAASMTGRAQRQLVEQARAQGREQDVVVQASGLGALQLPGAMQLRLAQPVATVADRAAVQQLAEELAQQENEHIRAAITDKAAFVQEWQAREMSRRKTIGKQLQLMDDVAQFKERDTGLQAARAHSLDTAEALEAASRTAIDAGERVQDALVRSARLSERVLAAQTQLTQASALAAAAAAQVAVQAPNLVQAAQGAQAAQLRLREGLQAQQQADQDAAQRLRAQAQQVQDSGLARLLQEQAAQMQARTDAVQVAQAPQAQAAALAAQALQRAQASAGDWHHVAQAMAAWADRQPHTLGELGQALQQQAQALQQLGEQSAQALARVYQLEDWSQAVIDEHAQRVKDVQQLHERRLRQDAIDRNAKKRAFFAKIVQFVVMAAAAIITVASLGTATPLTASAVAAMSTMEVATAVASAAASAAVIGAGTSALAQGINVLAGFQDEFNIKSVALTALSSALTAGALKGLQLGGGEGVFGQIADVVGNEHLAMGLTGSTINAGAQGAMKLVGLQDQFDWAQVAASGLAMASKGLVGSQLQAAGFGETIMGLGRGAAGGLSQFLAGAALGSRLDYFTLLGDMDEVAAGMKAQGGGGTPSGSTSHAGIDVAHDMGFNNNPLRTASAGIDLSDPSGGFRLNPLAAGTSAMPGHLNLASAWRPRIDLDLPGAAVAAWGRISDPSLVYPSVDFQKRSNAIQVASIGPLAGLLDTSSEPTSAGDASGASRSVMADSAERFPSVTVAPGDTVQALALRLGVPAHQLAALNGLANPNQISVGQTLLIPSAPISGDAAFDQSARTYYAQALTYAGQQAAQAAADLPRNMDTIMRLSNQPAPAQPWVGNAHARAALEVLEADLQRQAQATRGMSAAEIDVLRQTNDDILYGSVGRGQTASRLAGAIDNYQASLYGVLEAVGEVSGNKTLESYVRGQRIDNQAAADHAMNQARRLGAVDRWTDVNGAADLGNYTLGLGIQSLPYLGEVFAGGATGGAFTAARLGAGAATRAAGATLGGVIASYPSSVGDILQNQREQAGITHLPSALGMGVPYAALNAFGVEGAVARSALFRNTIGALDNLGGAIGAAARTGATAARTGVIEAFTETAQESLNQFGRIVVAPRETLFNAASNERFMESAIGGGILGTLFGGAAGGWRRSTGYDSVLDGKAPSAAPTVNGGSAGVTILRSPPAIGTDISGQIEVGGTPAIKTFEYNALAVLSEERRNLDGRLSATLAGGVLGVSAMGSLQGGPSRTDVLGSLFKVLDEQNLLRSIDTVSDRWSLEARNESAYEFLLNQNRLGMNPVQAAAQTSAGRMMLSRGFKVADVKQSDAHGVELTFDRLVPEPRLTDALSTAVTRWLQQVTGWPSGEPANLSVVRTQSPPGKKPAAAPDGEAAASGEGAATVLQSDAAPGEVPGNVIQMPLDDTSVFGRTVRNGYWDGPRAPVIPLFGSASQSRSLSADGLPTDAAIYPDGTVTVGGRDVTQARPGIPERRVTLGRYDSDGALHPARSPEMPAVLSMGELMAAARLGLVPGHNGVAVTDQFKSFAALDEIARALGVEVALTQVRSRDPSGALQTQWRVHSGTRDSVYTVPPYDYEQFHVVAHSHFYSDKPSAQDKSRLAQNLLQAWAAGSQRIRSARILFEGENVFYGPDWSLTPVESLRLSAAATAPIEYRQSANVAIIRLSHLMSGHDFNAIIDESAALARGRGANAIRIEIDPSGLSAQARERLLTDLRRSHGTNHPQKEVAYNFRLGSDEAHWMYTIQIGGVAPTAEAAGEALPDDPVRSGTDVVPAASYPLVIDANATGVYSTAHELAHGEVVRIEGDDRLFTMSFDRQGPHGNMLTPLDGEHYVLTIRDRSQVVTDYPGSRYFSNLQPDKAASHFSRTGDFDFGPGVINQRHVPDFISHVRYDDGKVVEAHNVFVNAHLLPRPDNKMTLWFIGDPTGEGLRRYGNLYELVESSPDTYVLVDEQGREQLAHGYWPAVQVDGRIFVTDARNSAHPTAAIRSNGKNFDVDAAFSVGLDQGNLVVWTNDSGGYRPTVAIADVVNLPLSAFEVYEQSTDAIFGTGYGRYAVATKNATVDSETAGQPVRSAALLALSTSGPELEDARHLADLFGLRSGRDGLTTLSLANLHATLDPSGVLSFEPRMIPSYLPRTQVLDAMALLLNELEYPLRTVRLTYDIGGANNAGTLANALRSGAFSEAIKNADKVRARDAVWNAISSYGERFHIGHGETYRPEGIAISGDTITVDYVRQLSDPSTVGSSASTSGSVAALQALASFAVDERRLFDPETPASSRMPAAGSLTARVDLTDSFEASGDPLGGVTYVYAPMNNHGLKVSIDSGIYRGAIQAHADREKYGSGKDMILSLLNRARIDGVPIDIIVDTWVEGMSDNYEKYLQYREMGYSPTEAARDTWSGKLWGREFGYDDISVQEDLNQGFARVEMRRGPRDVSIQIEAQPDLQVSGNGNETVIEGLDPAASLFGVDDRILDVLAAQNQPLGGRLVIRNADPSRSAELESLVDAVLERLGFKGENHRIVTTASGTNFEVRVLRGAARAGNAELSLDDVRLSPWWSDTIPIRHVVMTVVDDSEAIVEAAEEAPGRIEVTNLKRGSLPPGTGGWFLAKALEARQLIPTEELRIVQINEPRTLQAFSDGVPAHETVWGKTVADSLSRLGLRGVSYRFEQLSSGQLNMIVVTSSAKSIFQPSAVDSTEIPALTALRQSLSVEKNEDGSTAIRHGENSLHVSSTGVVQHDFPVPMGGGELGASDVLFTAIAQELEARGIQVSEVRQTLTLDPLDPVTQAFVGQIRNLQTVYRKPLPEVAKLAASTVVLDRYPTQPWGLALDRIDVDGSLLVMTAKPLRALQGGDLAADVDAVDTAEAAEDDRYRVLEAMVDAYRPTEGDSD